MASNALLKWKTDRARALDEMVNAHASIGGTARGRRYATQQVNQAYVVLVASHFQGFCRDLHTECVDVLIAFIDPPAGVDPIIRNRFLEGRSLDKGNAQPGSIGSDFGWFGLAFWTEVNQRLANGGASRHELENLNNWRNAIAHQSFDRVCPVGVPNLKLKDVVRWRRNCDKLADNFDFVMRDYLKSLTGKSPW